MLLGIYQNNRLSSGLEDQGIGIPSIPSENLEQQYKRPNNSLVAQLGEEANFSIIYPGPLRQLRPAFRASSAQDYEPIKQTVISETETQYATKHISWSRFHTTRNTAIINSSSAVLDAPNYKYTSTHYHWPEYFELDVTDLTLREILTYTPSGEGVSDVTAGIAEINIGKFLLRRTDGFKMPFDDPAHNTFEQDDYFAWKYNSEDISTSISYIPVYDIQNKSFPSCDWRLGYKTFEDGIYINGRLFVGLCWSLVCSSSDEIQGPNLFYFIPYHSLLQVNGPTKQAHFDNGNPLRPIIELNQLYYSSSPLSILGEPIDSTYYGSLGLIDPNKETEFLPSFYELSHDVPAFHNILNPLDIHPTLDHASNSGKVKLKGIYL